MKTYKKVISILLCLTLLMSYLPMMAQAYVTQPDRRVADPSTMDSWKQFFLPDLLTTENAGSVWTDKSVLTDETAFVGTGITRKHEESFLVALSAMASNMSVTGVANTPTDTMIILDLSSSMYDGFDRDPATVQTMLTSVNQSIEKLQNLNANNRVGVVVYYGGQDRNQSDANNSMVLLPLDRYSGTTTYLKANVTGGRLISVAVNAGVKNSAGKTMPRTTRTVTDVAGTYAQLGILDAMNQLLKADTVVPATADYQPGAARTPVMVFMSDGEPTAATHNFTQKVNAGMGNNTISIRSANETDFVTQLTASYAKEMVDAHYAQTDPLFYTLSLGTSVSLSVMDPANHTTATIDGYWDKLLRDGSVKITVYNSPNGWGAPTVKKSYTVSSVSVEGVVFPAGKSQKDYVDKAFTASTAGGLTDVFDDIVNQINLMSKYTPTLVSGNADLSGYISFVDKVGQYMTVTDIKGILIDNTLYSGAELASNFVAGGGNLGTYDVPTPLGDEMVGAVQARLGLKDADAARTLIGLAYEHGQLSYISPTEYSNYIGWYANAAGEFLGFWHEGIETMPEQTGDPKTDPVFIIKSYGYLGAVDESHGVEASDMMYATVQVRESIATGEQSVAFAVPAALIPLITYEVKLDLNGNMSGLKATGAEHPIRLVYEVALQEQINELTLLDTVSPEYLAANTQADGRVSFYTNQYEADNTTGYGKVNTYSYFNPSRQNDKYYYIEDAPVYADTQGNRYTGDAQPNGTFYRRYTVYTQNSATTVYRQLSDAAQATAKQRADGSWYIGTGNVHVNLDGYTVTKTDNPTDTLTDVYIPFVDAHNHSVGDLGYSFIVGATLGNNGRIDLIPATGIAMSKIMAEGATQPDAPFQFVITNTTNSADNGEYEARIVDENGNQSVTAVAFTDGKATVELYAGQILYIGGMTAGAVYTIEEIQTLEYIPQIGAFTVELTQGRMEKVNFVNADRSEGSLTLSKKVAHDLGSDYTIPEDKVFTIHVRLTGVGVTNKTFAAIGTVSSVTTDGQGYFTVDLKHDQQVQILGLPEGTVAYVTEPEPGVGMTASYRENGQEGDGVVTIPANVEVINTYVSDEVSDVNVVLNGMKNLSTDAGDWNGALFQFQLQKWTAEGWTTIATATASENVPYFDFNDALSREKLTTPGSYHYQVLEVNGGQTIGGVSYDATLHTFSITVTDKDMDGRLEIDQVISTHTGNLFQINDEGDWQIDIAFHNRYDATGCNVVLDVLKKLDNPSGSPVVTLSGFRFGLYDGDVLIAQSELSDGVGEARFILHYELEDEGIHTYTLKEIIPDNPVPGMIYDENSYTVVVEVTDNGDGTTTAKIVSINGETHYETPDFTNIYDPKDTSLEIDFVDKKLTGRELEDGEFTFELRGMDNDQLLTGTNDAEGNVIFSDVLTYDAAGTYHYELRETSADGKGILTDKAVYTVVVTVIDQNGQLSADYQIMTLGGTEVLFENTYSADPVKYTIEGTKELTGRVLLNDEFTFVLTQAADASGATADNALTWEARNFTDGSFKFPELTFEKANTYFFTVHEKASGSVDYGIIYDTARYLVTITVIDDLEGQLVVSETSISIIGGDSVENILFNNRYQPSPTSAQIPGSKELIGKVLGEADFCFALYEADEKWQEGRWLQNAENAADGSFRFHAINYDTAGPRFYLVKEVNGGQTIDGVAYDDTVYRVRVEVTDDLRGQLHAETFFYNEDGIAQETILFRNRYIVTGEGTVTLTGTKDLLNKDLVDGAFTFELYETGDSFAVSGEPVLTAVNKDGAFEMTLSYKAEDVGSTRYYVVMERNAGQTIDGITYSAVKYYVTVEIGDDGVGGITTETTITDGTNSVTSLDFVNEYQPEPTEVELDGLKTMIGKDLSEGDFRFALYESDENWQEGQWLQTAENAADGSFCFSAISYDTIGTYYFLVKEVNGGQIINGVIYDDTVYRVIVDVTDNGTGALKSTLAISDGQGEAVEEMTFENTFVEPPPKTGDTGIFLWIALMTVSCGAIVTMAAFGKKKAEDEA